MKSKINEKVNSYPRLMRHIKSGLIILENLPEEGTVVNPGDNSYYQVGDRREDFTTYDVNSWEIFNGSVTLSN